MLGAWKEMLGSLWKTPPPDLLQPKPEDVPSFHPHYLLFTTQRTPLNPSFLGDGYPALVLHSKGLKVVYFKPLVMIFQGFRNQACRSLTFFVRSNKILENGQLT